MSRGRGKERPTADVMAQVLKRHDWVFSRAADELGVAVSTLSRWVREAGLSNAVSEGRFAVRGARRAEAKERNAKAAKEAAARRRESLNKLRRRIVDHLDDMTREELLFIEQRIRALLQGGT